jgi:excisionase family DNA binding protein
MTNSGTNMFEQRNERTIEPMLLTARQTARILNISERTLATYTKSRLLPVVRIGRCVRYSLDDLKRWIEGHAQRIRSE